MLLVAALLSWFAFAAPPDAADRLVVSAEAAQEIEDPRRLIESADHHRDQGDLELARTLYALAMDREEWFHEGYISLRDELREALLLEHLGQYDEAAEKYRAAQAEDIQTTMMVLRIRSQHPDRDALFEAAVADLKDRVARAKAGEEVRIYLTSKGAERPLQVMSSEEVIAALAEGQEKFRYCYIEDLVITKEVLPELPDRVFFNRCVIGRLRVVDHDVESFDIVSIVLDELSFGKTWMDDRVNSLAYPASRIEDLKLLKSVILGRANFQEVPITGRNALFVMTVFEGPADFRDTLFHGTADFRYSVFGEEANYKRMTLTNAAFFGNTRYTGPVTFREMFSEEDLYFNSAVFEGPANFDKCEWARGATFENSDFRGPVSFIKSKMGGRLNMSRTLVSDELHMQEMQLYGMDFIGSHLKGNASFIDVHFRGKVRFSLDDVTRAQHIPDPKPLLPLYRDYQGDKDRETPLTDQSSYGVTHVDDLIARIEGDIAFNNSVFEGFCIFERVRFGNEGSSGLASFYNTQFLGETHFERTEWFADADFTTIFANELALNEATFHETLILDDANIRGRVTLTDAEFIGDATISFYAAEFAAFEIERDQVERGLGDHRLFYDQCIGADGEGQEGSRRIDRALRGVDYDADVVKDLCYDRVADEFVLLKETFGERAMTRDEDWAYWWIRHHQMHQKRDFGGVAGFFFWLFNWPVFELAFGWGVRLQNLAFTSILVCLVFAVLYRLMCPNTVCVYDGREVPIRDIPWHGLIYISLQSFGAFNTGWDFGEDDATFQYLNTAQTFIGIIVLTFFVGAYTRMILA